MKPPGEGYAGGQLLLDACGITTGAHMFQQSCGGPGKYLMCVVELNTMVPPT